MNAPETLLPEKIGVYADGADLRLKLTDILAHGVTRYIRSDLIPRWVSVEDELPEKNGTYFCLRNGVGREHVSHVWVAGDLRFERSSQQSGLYANIEPKTCVSGRCEAK